MNKTELINYFINLRNYGHYLEITVHNEKENFIHIRCADKKNITSGSVNNFEATNDNNNDKFDLIFIDGVHTEEQVLKDINYAQQKLSKHGVIILHDCMPPDAWHQRDIEEFHAGENWNGTVWKAALRVFNESFFKCTLLDMDWGCGIIDTNQSQLPVQINLPAKLNYKIHYPLLLKYKTSISAFFRNQVKVFYHLACMGNWLQVFKEQMLKLQQNGFNKIELTVLGTKENLVIARSICDKLNIEAHMAFSAAQITYFETPALLAIEDYARQNEGYVLYLHSKGVSNPGDINKVKWRRLMMKELVDNWEFCMLQLPKYDVIGVNWRVMPPDSHFCGNFWYASTRYLRKLADFKHYYENHCHQIIDAINSKRLTCEFWISSGTETPKMLSLYCANVDFCNCEFWRNK